MTISGARAVAIFCRADRAEEDFNELTYLVTGRAAAAAKTQSKGGINKVNGMARFTCCYQGLADLSLSLSPKMMRAMFTFNWSLLPKSQAKFRSIFARDFVWRSVDRDLARL